MKSAAIGVVALVIVGFAVGAVASRSERTAAESALVERVDVATGIYDPPPASDELPAGFRQVLNRDDILPVYEPEFVEAAGVDWDDDALVIGLEIAGEARAYPVSFLNWREMVIDRVAGIPVLVTW